MTIRERYWPDGTQRRLLTVPGLLILATAMAALSPSPSRAQTDNAPRAISRDDFLNLVADTIDARQERVVEKFDTAATLNEMNFLDDAVKYARGDLRTRCYFDFGDVDKFRSLVSKGLTGGVVEDPQYIDDLGSAAVALYQNVNTFSIIVSSHEARYNGFVILRNFMNTPERRMVQSSFGTYIHEAIHSAAFGAGRTDLDVDEDPGEPVIAGAPEYIGYYFFLEQLALAEAEHKALSRTKDAFMAMHGALQSKDPDDDKALFESVISDFMVQATSAAEDYLSEARSIFEETEQSFLAEGGRTVILDRQMVRELMALWRGKADWDKLISDAEAYVSALQRFRESRAKLEGPSPEFESLTDFFFKKSCLRE